MSPSTAHAHGEPIVQSILWSKEFHAWVVFEFYCFPIYLPDVGSLLLFNFYKWISLKQNKQKPIPDSIL